MCVVCRVIKLVLRNPEVCKALVQVAAAPVEVVLQCLKGGSLAAHGALEVCDTCVCTVCIGIQFVLHFSLTNQALLKSAGVALQFVHCSVQVAKLQRHGALIDGEGAHAFLQVMDSRKQVCKGRL